MDYQPCEERVRNEATESYDKAENGDVAKVLEEFLAAHIVACVEDDRGQEEVEEDALLETEGCCLGIADAVPEDDAENDSKDQCERGLVSNRRLVLLNQGATHKEKEHEDDKGHIELHRHLHGLVFAHDDRTSVYLFGHVLKSLVCLRYEWV